MLRLTTRLYFTISKYDPRKDYYKILLLNQHATQQQIKKSFRDLAKRYHPDINKGNQQKFKDINEAHQILASEQTKKQYDLSRRTNNNQINSQKEYNKSNARQYYSEDRQQYRSHQNHQYQYDQENPQQFREYLRKKHEQEMKKNTKNRQNYDNLGRGYDNYEKFREQTLHKKKQKYEQKTQVNQESVRKQQEKFRKFSQKKEEQYKQKMKQQMKKDLLFRYNRGVQNGQKTWSGIKEMGNILKDLFKKK